MNVGILTKNLAKQSDYKLDLKTFFPPLLEKKTTDTSPYLGNE